jgi:CHAT domain-containing protein/Tfp pilus assembly protein PilF
MPMLLHYTTWCLSCYYTHKGFVHRTVAFFISAAVLSLLTITAEAYQVEQPSQGKLESEPLSLNLGNSISRKLRSGERHYYLIYLTSGQYAHIRQYSGENYVRILDPYGREVADIELPRRQGPDHISIIAEATGSYKLEIIGTPYDLKLIELRQAIPQDRIRIAAQRAYAEGWKLRRLENVEARRRAIRKYEESLPLWREIGNRYWEGQTLNYIGYVYTLLAENRKALDYLNQALEIFQAEGDLQMEEVIFNDICIAYASRFGRKARLCWLGEILNDIGVAYARLGERQRALNNLKRGLKFRQAINDPFGVPRTLRNIGNVYRSLGEFEEAVNYYNQSIQSIMFYRVHNRPEIGLALSGIGGIYSSMGKNQKALECYTQALRYEREHLALSNESLELGNIGWTYFLMGDSRKALDYLNRSLQMSKAIGDRIAEAQTLNNIGRVYDSLGDKQKALEYYHKALPLSRAVSDPSGEALTLLSIARAQRDLDNLNEARANIEQALKIIESLRSKVGRQELRATYFATVQEYYEFYIDLLMTFNRLDKAAGYDGLALQATERARARSLLELLNEARAGISQGIDLELGERERDLIRRLNDKGERLFQLKSDKHKQEQVTEAEKEINGLATELEEIEAEIKAKSPRYAALTQPQPLSLIEIQKLVDEDTLILEYALGTERSYLWMVTPTSIRSYELPRRSEIEAAARRVYDLLTARNRQVKSKTAKQREARLKQAEAEYNEAAVILGRMLLGQVASQLKSKRLLIVADGILQYIPFAALPISENDDLEPLVVRHEIVNLPSASTLGTLRRGIAGRKPAARTVAVLADPVFERDDPRVIPASKSQKFKNYVRKSSSAPAFDIKSLNPDIERSARDVGIADEDLRISRLPFTKDEAKAIMSLVPDSECRAALDFEASQDIATSKELGQYRVIHFATHGLLNSVHPELSGILLSLVDKRGNLKEGFLQLHEIYNLKLPAELVVLSACQTGLGKEIKGEGLVGLTRGFMYAGAARVMASLWKVDDRATAELMKYFYQGMLGERRLRPAAALREAQIEMWKQERWKHPYYWAAFLLQGEWR